MQQSSRNNDNQKNLGVTDLTVKAVCVYCGSSANVSEIYRLAATRLGVLLAENGLKLVYGGGKSGLMGLVAEGVLKGGGEAYGVIPHHIANREISHTGLTELHLVDTMHERKQMMVDLADAFVILPGGLGTLDEFFEIMTWRQLALHDKPIVVVNIEGYWSPLLTLIDRLIDQGFARESDRQMLQVVDSVEDVPAALETAPRERIDPQTKWI
jgi:uncharacterized protein (TIGR00730 family)